MKRRSLRGSLFAKIYITLLASLALVALASGAFIHFRQGEGWGMRREHVLSTILSADGGVLVRQSTLEQIAEAIDADIAVYDTRGRLTASIGDPLPANVLDQPRWRNREFTILRLADGRTVVAHMRQWGPGGSRKPFAFAVRNPLLHLALVAIVIGVAAYPVVRHLTRRLEGLKRGVDNWGSGALATRVSEEGADEVAAVARSFNKAASHVERLVAAHRSLLANASHELRSPLARLRMAIDLYEKGGNEGTRAEIIRNLGELDMLVEEILLASRLDHSQQPHLSEPVDLLAIAAEEAAHYDIAVSGVQAIVSGDPRLLSRLVRNLLQNALRHGAPPVEILLEKIGAKVRLSVSDHGQGIAPDEKERVFEPFYRPSGRSETVGGWGLGLSLVRQIAGLHGAYVRYETPDEGGARFVVEFSAGT